LFTSIPEGLLVSESFGKDLEEVLKVQGIRSKSIVKRTEKVGRKNPPTIVNPRQAGDFLEGIARSVGIGANLLTIGASIAGLAACNVM